MSTAADRFWSKVEKTDDCWLWTAYLMPNGYAFFHVGGRDEAGNWVRMYAHRWAYMQVKGPISEGLEIDHLCRMRHCVNPDHLEPVTHKENQRRTTGHRTGPYNVGTHCPSGHERTPENVRMNTYGYRVCRQCARDVSRRMREKKKRSTV